MLTDEQIEIGASGERDDLLDHIYEYGTNSEGVLRLFRKYARTIEALVRAECVPTGHVVVPVELLQDAISSIDDYRGGIDFGSYDRKLLGRLKSALPAAPGTTPKEPSNG